MIYYREGYKYQLTKDYQFNIGQSVGSSGGELWETDTIGFGYWKASPFLRMYPNGNVVQLSGYAWDGASGPAIDDDTNQVPALEHDGMYQLIRAGILPENPYRKIADKRLRGGVRKRGMNWFRAWYWYTGVRLAGYKAATVKRKVLTAE